MSKLPLFKIRASAAQSILGVKGLGDTGENYVKNWIKSHVYGHSKTFSNKYVQKGLACEEAGIDLVSSHLGEFLVKYESPDGKQAENDKATGNCDILTATTVDDIKNSWDCYTFPLFEKECKNLTYIAQGNTYLWLYDRDIFRLHYCLNDAPDDMILQSYWYAHKDEGLKGDEVNEELFNVVKAKMTYSHLPTELRVKTFIIERDDALIQKISDRVDVCRELIKSLQ